MYAVREVGLMYRVAHMERIMLTSNQSFVGGLGQRINFIFGVNIISFPKQMGHPVLAECQNTIWGGGPKLLNFIGCHK